MLGLAILVGSLTTIGSAMADAGGSHSPAGWLGAGNALEMVDPIVVASPFVPADVPTRFGRGVLAADVGVVVIGRQGLEGVTATIVPLPTDGGAVLPSEVSASDVVFAERAVAAAGRRVVVVDATQTPSAAHR